MSIQHVERDSVYMYHINNCALSYFQTFAKVDCPANDGCLISYGESSKVEIAEMMTFQRQQQMGTFSSGIAQMHTTVARSELLGYMRVIHVDLETS